MKTDFYPFDHTEIDCASVQPIYRLRTYFENKLVNFASQMNSSVSIKKVFMMEHEEIYSIVGSRAFFSNDESGFFFFESKKGFGQIDIGKTCEIVFTGETMADIQKELMLFSGVQEIDTYVNWVYNKQGDSVSVPLVSNSLPLPSFYPFLKDGLSDYYQRFMESDQAILVLIGPPGTGKSSFIKGLMHHTRKSATVTFDKDLLSSDTVFAEFIYGDSTFFVLEDADNLLLPRKDGNDLMAKFLNVGEGLVKVPGKKMIFTTNLPNVSDIDPALIRPGRCFDVLQFRNLTGQESDLVRKDLGILETGVGGTLTEICNGVRAQKKSSFGFVP